MSNPQNLVDELLESTNVSVSNNGIPFNVDTQNATTTTLEYPKNSDNRGYGNLVDFFTKLQPTEPGFNIVDM